jgi:protein-S-isoprenylcysteine O-methyltransferase Ste14
MLPPMKLGNALCSIFLEVSLLLFVVIVVLVPVHIGAHLYTTTLNVIETATIGIALIAYTSVYLWKRSSPFLLFGSWVRTLPISTKPLWWIVQILVGIPFIWFIGKMPFYVGILVIDRLCQVLGESFRVNIHASDPYLPFIWTLLAALYYGYLVWYRTSPLFAFWRLLSYKKVGVIKEVTWKRGLTMWVLHLVIVYFFASTLVGFLFADFGAARAIGIPTTPQEFFAWSKYLIWGLTVAGCLLGYSYSVVSILWGSFIRNLDFTITGWLTNAFCYTPLLGAAIWHMMIPGRSPLIQSGPLAILILGMSLLLNLLYMLSIWNLGTKFDLMADKGVRSSYFYSVIRHPNYLLEACMFAVMECTLLGAGVGILGICMFFFLYWIRSEREDNFMTYSNPDYTIYKQQTPYKFIPGIY